MRGSTVPATGALAACLVVFLAIAGLVLPPAASGARAAETNAEPEVPPGFAEWKTAFRRKALVSGIRADVFDQAFEGVKPRAQVIKRDQHQPEFVRPIWSYLDSAVSQTRIANGRKMLERHGALLSRVEKDYGVPARVIVAIWGLETSYGAIMGGEDIIAALATLAYQGRRQAFGERELMAALKIIQSGDKSRTALKGSWAGAMGHTQFIPTTFEAYAVDYDGDGRRDIWDSLPDVFASTANYLKRHGWDEEYIWGREVEVPQRFDYSLTGRGKERSIATWSRLGVRRPGGRALPNADIKASVIIPAGHAGPAFFVYDNFNVIMRYNNATSYALAIGHLSDRLIGRPAFKGSWPRDTELLKRAEREELQERLNAAGYSVGPVDGILGARTREAIREFQKDKGMPADGFANSALLVALREHAGTRGRL